MRVYAELTEEQKAGRRESSRNWRLRNPEKAKQFKRHVPTREKACAYSKAYRERRTPEQVMLDRVRSRALEKGVPFDLTVEDIVIPEFCPYFPDKRLEVKTKYAPSLDRIDPALGYVRGNVEVISNFANTIKSYGTADEHRRIADRMDTLKQKSLP